MPQPCVQQATQQPIRKASTSPTQRPSKLSMLQRKASINVVQSLPHLRYPRRQPVASRSRSLSSPHPRPPHRVAHPRPLARSHLLLAPQSGSTAAPNRLFTHGPDPPPLIPRIARAHVHRQATTNLLVHPAQAQVHDPVALGSAKHSLALMPHFGQLFSVPDPARSGLCLSSKRYPPNPRLS